MSIPLAIATGGHLCGPTGTGAEECPIITDLAPQLNATSLEPGISTEGQSPPVFEALSVEPVPETESASSPEAPDFELTPVINPRPSADTEVVSDTPETLIRPLEDLRPSITNKGE